MLHFIYGRSASGKTYTLMETMKKSIESGRKVIILVPEQFSFDTEKSILHQFGDHVAADVTVLSFTRICDEVERLVGGGCDKMLTEAGKHILLNRALQHTAGDLKIWGRQARLPGFCEILLDSIEEFKTEGITPEILRNAAVSSDRPRLAAKLNDTALIYEYYNSLIEQYFIDPSDRLEKVYDKLESCKYFEDKIVLIDSFKGFTGQQFRIMERIITQADEVHIALTLDPDIKKPYDIFENVRKTARRLKSIAASHHVSVTEEKTVKDFLKIPDDLKAVEQILSDSAQEIVADGNHVTVCCAETVFDEADYAARTIRRLVREEGYRYRDFVIIARNTVPYEEAVAIACEKNDISCFIDRRMPLSDFPPAVAMLSVIGTIKRFTTESVFRFSKSGIGIFTTEELSLLENYCRLWNIDGKDWLKEWDMNPKGLQAENSPVDIEKLNAINELRTRVILPLNQFRSSFSGTAAQRGTAVMQLFDDVHAAVSFAKLRCFFDEKGQYANADALRQSFDQVVNILDDLAECFGQDTPDTDEYCKALNTAVTATTVGIAPQTLDEVSFGAADRIRPSRPKIAFILGCNQGVFPQNTSVSGLFGITERSDMIDLGLNITDKTVSDSIDENYLVYSNLCCATDRLYLSYAKRNAEQEEMEPSAFFELIRSKINCKYVFEPQTELDADCLPETADTAFSAACGCFETDPYSASAIFDAIGDDNYALRAEKIKNAAEQKVFSISPRTAEKLYGTNMRISPSSIDVYHSCKFRYFCRYGLRAQKLQPAVFDQMQRGTMIHYILQRVVEIHGDQIGFIDDETVYRTVDDCVREYLGKIPGFSNACPPHIQVMVDNMTRCSKEVVIQLRNEFAQSDFKPSACELKFGLEGREPIRIPYDKGQILLRGSIDRVDTWNGYVRIVDYKTGGKEFKLPDVLVGHNLQMLLYLYAITRHTDYTDSRSAGIFYLPAKRKYENLTLPMDGLMCDDQELIHAMEKDNAGQFIPEYKLKKDGELYANSASHFVGEEDFDVIFDYIEQIMQDMGNGILSGDIAVDPVDGLKTKACDYCDFVAVCNIGDRPHKHAEDYTNAQVIEEIVRKEDSDNGE